MIRRIIAAGSIVAACLSSAQQSAPKPAVDQLIPWLLNENGELRNVPFAQVIFDTTGKHVVAFDKANPVDQRVVKAVAAACESTMQRVNAPDSAIQSIARINEVSSHFEDGVREALNATAGFVCEIPPTADGKLQRSGYPDLKLTDKESGRVFYLDPKLYAAGSRESSFRTFYFEPKVATNKVRDDAVHFILGFEHEPRSAGHWNFTRWDIVDLSHFNVKLKAEFQGSNRDMYRPEAIVATSAK